MAIFVIILMLLFFFAYPTWSIFQRQITIKGVTVMHDETPCTFWSVIGFLYNCGFAFPYIMLKLPYSGVFLVLMGVNAVVLSMCYLLKR